MTKVLRTQKKIVKWVSKQNPINPLVLETDSEDEDPTMDEDAFELVEGDVVDEDDSGDGDGVKDDEDVVSSSVEALNEEEYVYEEGFD